MKKLKSQIAAILLVTIGFDYCEALEEKTNGSKVLICYVDKWSEHRKIWAFNFEDIYSPFCTHIAYAFANVGPLEDIGGSYRRFNEIKRFNKKLKTLLSVGDIFHGNYRTFGDMAADVEARRKFVINTAPFLRAVKFDGLDLVWNTPNLDKMGKPMADKSEDYKNYVLLLKNLRHSFELEKETGKDRLLLTVAVAADYIGGYDVPEVNRYVDYISLINFMSLNGFDGLVGHKGVTRFMAGLYKSKSDKSPDQSVNWGRRVNLLQSAMAKAWLAAGASEGKILLGLPLFGRLFQLVEPYNPRPNAAATFALEGINFAANDPPATLGYYQTCNLCKEHGFFCALDPEALVPYAHKGGLWVSFEDSYSLQYKLTWLKNNDLAGAAVWSMDTDDFDDTCQMGKYPLLSVISQCLLYDYYCEPVNKNNDPAIKMGENTLPDSALAPTPSITTIIAVVAAFLLKSTYCF